MLRMLILRYDSITEPRCDRAGRRLPQKYAEAPVGWISLLIVVACEKERPIAPLSIASQA